MGNTVPNGPSGQNGGLFGNGVYYDQPVVGLCQVCKVKEVRTFKTIKGVILECDTCKEEMRKKMQAQIG